MHTLFFGVVSQWFNSSFARSGRAFDRATSAEDLFRFLRRAQDVAPDWYGLMVGYGVVGEGESVLVDPLRPGVPVALSVENCAAQALPFAVRLVGRVLLVPDVPLPREYRLDERLMRIKVGSTGEGGGS